MVARQMSIAHTPRVDYYFETVKLKHHAPKPIKSAQRLTVMGEHPMEMMLPPPLEVPEGP